MNRDNGLATAEKATPAEVAAASIQARALPADSGMERGVSLLFWLANKADEIDKWWTARRDLQLRDFWKGEPILSGAVYSMVAKMKSMGYEIDGPSRQVNRYQPVLANAEFGKGWSHLMSKVIEDYLTCDRGAFIELIRASNDDIASPVIGLAHLDACRCYPTGDLEFPVLYSNRKTGQIVRLADYQVLHIVSMPSPDEAMHEVGFCAVSRALKAAQIIRDVILYKREKLSSRPNKGIVVVNGVTNAQLQDAIKDSDEQQDNAGLQRFGKMIALASLDPSAAVDLKMVEFASLPDGYDEEQTMTLYAYILALDFGVDAREFWPATASGATKADALVQAQKARGKGPGDIITTIERAFNWKVLPDSLTFRFDYQDDEEDRARAELKKAKVDTINSMYLGQGATPGFIDRNEARQLAHDEKILPEEFLQVDLTDNVTADDVEQPKDDAQQAQPQLNAGDTEQVQDGKATHDYGSTQFNLPDDIARELLDFGAEIPDEKLAEDGREGEPHITVKYGLIGKNTDDVATLRKLLVGQSPVTVTFGAMSLFPSDVYDVLKVDVVSEELEALNAKMTEALDTVDTQKTYNPHATVAYLKKGKADQYIGNALLKGRKVTFDKLIVSDKDGKRSTIQLHESETVKAEDIIDLPFPEGTEEALRKLETKFEKVAAKSLAAQQKQIMEAVKNRLGLKAPSNDDEGEWDIINWEESSNDMADDYLPIIREIASDGAMAAAAALESIAFSVDMALVNEPVLEWSRRYSYELVKGLNETTRASLRQAMIDFQQGKLGARGLPDLVKVLEPVFGYERAQTIAATETTRAFAEGNAETWRKSGLAILEVWKTSADEAVCVICGGLNEQVVALEEEFVVTTRLGKTERSKVQEFRMQRPPAHVRCRCRTIARITRTVSTTTPKPEAPIMTPAEQLSKELLAFEKSISWRANERAGIWDAKGMLRVDKAGGKSSVNFTATEADLAKGGILTHNHPSGNSFSMEDYKFAATQAMSQMRAVTKDYRFILEPHPTYGWVGDDLAPTIARIELDLREEIYGKIRAGSLTVDQANAMHFHELWTRVSKERGIGYRREEWPSS